MDAKREATATWMLNARRRRQILEPISRRHQWADGEGEVDGGFLNLFGQTVQQLETNYNDSAFEKEALPIEKLLCPEEMRMWKLI
ncbi:hypothetical protein QN277_003906 [Acacia crassicarpa]|uniref:Uncharacterized protein n=1 Tax=Acacia crassicarpa TaxID=499986 RepID=A0AAE1MBB1_9FABA|nr:hypothetical protein QN277_003906 [Acacia crassicarpa]